MLEFWSFELGGGRPELGGSGPCALKRGRRSERQLCHLDGLALGCRRDRWKARTLVKESPSERLTD